MTNDELLKKIDGLNEAAQNVIAGLEKLRAEVEEHKPTATMYEPGAVVWWTGFVTSIGDGSKEKCADPQWRRIIQNCGGAFYTHDSLDGSDYATVITDADIDHKKTAQRMAEGAIDDKSTQTYHDGQRVWWSGEATDREGVVTYDAPQMAVLGITCSNWYDWAITLNDGQIFKVKECDIAPTPPIEERPKPPKYEEGKVFWDKEYEVPFIINGQIADKDDWHFWGSALHRDGDGLSCPKCEIIDTPIYEYNGDRYIWDGGDERVPKNGEWYLDRTGQVTLRYLSTNQIPRKMLIKLTEVG